jgi:GNAT superfamily N-acetyltransferase
MSQAPVFQNLALRPEQPEDEPILYSIYASTRQEEIRQANWDEATKKTFLQLQFQAMRKGYAFNFPNAEFTIICSDDSTLGRIVVDRSDDEIRLVDVALLPMHRNRGIGTWLLQTLQEESRGTHRPLRLSVLDKSPAKRLYDRLGFHELEQNGPCRHMEWLPA